MRQQDKRRAEKLIDLYLNYIQSVSHDAGWHGDSTIGRFIEFGGDVPAPTGNDKSNAQSIREIQYLRNVHFHTPMVLRLMRELKAKDGEAFLAMLFDRAYRGRTVKMGDRMVRQTSEVVAASLELELTVYIAAAERGRRKLIALEEKHLDREWKASTAMQGAG